MSTALTNFMKTTEVAIPDEAFGDALAENASEAQYQAGGSGDGEYLSFSGKTGRWTIGRDKDTPEEDDMFILEPRMYTRGWICWKASKAVGRHEWLPVQNPDQLVLEADLEDHGPYNVKNGEGWYETSGFGLYTTDGEFKPVKFSVNSKSGVISTNDLIKKAGARMQQGEPSMAILSLSEEPFTAQGNKNFKPIFNVDCWVTREAVAAYVEEKMTLEDLMDGKEPKKAAAKRKPRKSRKAA